LWAKIFDVPLGKEETFIVGDIRIGVVYESCHPSINPSGVRALYVLSEKDKFESTYGWSISAGLKTKFSRDINGTKYDAVFTVLEKDDKANRAKFKVELNKN